MQYFNPDKVDTFDFEFRDITADELQGMVAVANYILSRPRDEFKKSARKAARYLLKATAWIEREAYATVKGINNYGTKNSNV